MRRNKWACELKTLSFAHGNLCPRWHATNSRPSWLVFLFDIVPCIKIFMDFVGVILALRDPLCKYVTESGPNALNLNTKCSKWQSELREAILH